MHDVTTEQPFVIERVNAKLSALERRAEYLQRRIKEHSPADRGRSFDITELQAVEAAITAIKLHRAMLEPETSPVLALDELTNALDGLCDPVHMTSNLLAVARYTAAVFRARKVLKDLGEDD